MVVLFVYLLLFAYTVCDECNDEGLTRYRDLYIVENIETSRTDEERPSVTLPPGLSIKPSSIPGGGLGVWTERDFPKYTRFGPYTGMIRDNVEDGNYAWQVYDENVNFKFYVDALYKNSSNWLRYINCARTIDEENMYLYQYNNEIFYVSYECIKKGTELLIWYGENYGLQLGLKRTAADYHKRFKEDDIKYIIENSISENVNKIYKKCYKFFNREAFRKPPGRFQNFDKYCIYDGSYLVCKYGHCKKNPCTNRFDCGECEGYCKHLGVYIKIGEKFSHADQINTCVCRDDGHFGCTISPQSLEQLCSS